MEANIDNEFSYEQVENDFINGKLGQISFNYHGSHQTLCYIPIENTNWIC